METQLFWRGLLLGIAIAAPVGPIGVLGIRRTLAAGRAVGLASGLGAATADANYGLVAALGLTAASDVLVSQQLWLRLAAGAFLCWLGLRTLLSAARDLSEQTPGNLAAAGGGRRARVTGLAGAYFSTLALTLTNPATILSFIAVFAGLGLAASGGAAEALWLVLGIFAGSAAWWLLLSTGVGHLRGRLTPRLLRWVNVISGAVIPAFGVAALLAP